jgi:hypothetical protein
MSENMKKAKDIKPKLLVRLEVKNVSDFVRRVEVKKRRAEKSDNKADLLFRGQRVDWPLLPKLARLNARVKPLAKVESLIFEEFRRTHLPHVDKVWDDSWDVLAYAQHHGLPTRLLDWTFNALQALWFAVEKPPEKDENGKEMAAVVWVFSPVMDDYRVQEENLSPFTVKFSMVFRPRIVDHRLSSQAGAFTVHKINSGDRVVPFNNHGRYKNKLSKITIQPDCFPTIRRQLDMLGINSATTFPDLDGLCRHLEWRYFWSTDESE